MTALPPQSIEAEKTLLGAVLRDPASLGRVRGMLRPETFHGPDHGRIYAAIVKLFDADQPFDPFRVAQTLEEDGVILNHGPAYLAELSDQVATSANVPHYARVIVEKAALRKIRERCSKLAETVCSPTAKADETIRSGLEFFQKLHDRYVVCAGDAEKAENASWAQRVEKYVESIDSVKSVNSVNGSVKLSVNDLYRSVNAVNSRDEACVRKAVQKLVKQNILEPLPGSKAGNYRLVDHTENILNVWDAEDLIDLNLKWPFDLQERFYLPPRSVVIVAGVSNAGKTGFMMDVAFRNNLNMETYYLVLSNESHPSKLKSRARRFGPKEAWEGCTFVEKPSGAFQDAIRPNALNIIDYLQVYDEFWKITQQIAEIADKLENGVTIIGLQKQEGKLFAKGGESTREKAELYINLDLGDPQQLSFMKIKTSKTANSYESVKYRVNPSGILIPAWQKPGDHWTDTY